MGYETIKCSECYYFQRIHRANTCQLKGGFLSDKVVGCYSGSKVRNVELEKLHRAMKEAEDHLNKIRPNSYSEEKEREAASEIIRLRDKYSKGLPESISEK